MQKLREAKVFLSSSFQDMHAERDYLLRDVFPLVELVLRCYFIRLRVIDLRGTAQQCEKEAYEREVFSMCLNEMDACRPRMLGLVGDRYGWVPYRQGASDSMMEAVVQTLAAEHGLSLEDVSGKSITHLEILYGLRIMNLSMCYFYFREIVNKDRLSYDDRRMYLDGDTCGLDRLKNDLRRAYDAEIAPESQTGAHLIRYAATIRNGLAEDMSNLGQKIREDLIHSFIIEGVLNGKRDPDWYLSLINYWDEMADHTVPNPFLAVLLRSASPVLRVTGPEGVGKSVLLAQYLYALPEETLAISFVCGLMPYTDTAGAVIDYLLRQFCFLTGRKAPGEGAEALLGLLERYCAVGRRVVIVMDGLERLRRMEWQIFTALLDRLPEGVQLVLAAGEGFFAPDEKALSISPPGDAGTLIAMLSARQGKKLDPELLQLLLASAARDGANPLRLSLLVRYLLTMRREDYQAYCGADAHLQWMRHVLESPEARTVEGCASLTVRRAAASDPELINGVLRILRDAKTTLDEEAMLRFIQDEHLGVPQPKGWKALLGNKAYLIRQRQQFIQLQAQLRPLLLFDATSRNWALSHASFHQITEIEA